MDSLRHRTFSGVIFDLDGTLIDSSVSLAKAWTQWGIEFRVGPDPSRNWNGMTSADIIRCLVPAEVADRAVARIEELEVNETSDVVALPGSLSALRALAGARVAVATSGTAAVASARLAAAGLPVPEVVVTAADVEHGKPAPDPFLVAARRLGVDPGECLVVEDAPAGVEAGKAAGCAVLALLTTSRPAELEAADAVIADLSAVTFAAGPDGVAVSTREDGV